MPLTKERTEEVQRAATGGLTLEQILAATDRTPVEVQAPEWGGVVYILPMSGNDRDAFEAELTSLRDENGRTQVVGVRARLCARMLCDENGNLMEFTAAAVCGSATATCGAASGSSARCRQSSTG